MAVTLRPAAREDITDLPGTCAGEPMGGRLHTPPRPPIWQAGASALPPFAPLAC